MCIRDSYYYVKNLQGDVLAIVDKTGAEKVSYVYLSLIHI